MWPFEKSKEKPPNKAFDWNGWNDKWPIGKEFIYMGERFKVIKNFTFIPYGGFSHYDSLIPEIYARHLTKNGTFETIIFNEKELENAPSE